MEYKLFDSKVVQDANGNMVDVPDSELNMHGTWEMFANSKFWIIPIMYEITDSNVGARRQIAPFYPALVSGDKEELSASVTKALKDLDEDYRVAEQPRAFLITGLPEGTTTIIVTGQNPNDVTIFSDTLTFTVGSGS
jgi:hypothetical protein